MHTDFPNQVQKKEPPPTPPEAESAPVGGQICIIPQGNECLQTYGPRVQYRVHGTLPCTAVLTEPLGADTDPSQGHGATVSY